ncbi:MAG TPA: response regulator transcription factor [Acidimicrobiia bacterium]|nr:response regulator transcription factor [Acidimicrobiia bacterium]
MKVAVYPEAFSEGLGDGLVLADVSIAPLRELAAELLVTADPDLLVIELGDQPMRRLRELDRLVEDTGLPVLLILEPDQLVLIESSPGVQDFVLTPINPVEFRLRLHRLVRTEATDEILVFKDLELNPLTYQATLAGHPMDLTYMEYELLRFLVENPVRVWSREQLLSRVWGYEYYGGARTVDVHVRRLRAKLGEERSSWITTVRSVGYRFG